MITVANSTKPMIPSKALSFMMKRRMVRKTIADECLLADEPLPEVPLLPVAMSRGYVIGVPDTLPAEMGKDHLK
ncbi:hypothetical protein TPCV302_05490 [Cutibacterium avidum]|nr:hypothetical protein EZV78_12065 [Cutibacterium avidum]BCQ06243.1 hypothetical protein TPCV14_22870 [Cutibacterium avidum]BDY01157.1 hypothetical protein TPCV302_05490 [Cutibacterium avidum]